MIIYSSDVIFRSSSNLRGRSLKLANTFRLAIEHENLLRLAEYMSCLAGFRLRPRTVLAALQPPLLITERHRHDFVIGFRRPDGTARQSSGSQDLDGIAPDNLLLPDLMCALHFAFDRPEEYTNAIL